MINDNSDVTMTWGVNYKDWSLYKTEVSGRHVLVLQEKKKYIYIYIPSGNGEHPYLREAGSPAHSHSCGPIP